MLKWAVIVAMVAGGVYLSGWGQTLPRPDITDGWYGRGKQKPDNTEIKEFKINVPDEILTDLKQRLNNARFGEDLENNENFYYGMNVATMKNIVAHWKDKYDWRKHEKLLNQFPQFKTQIEGIDVHFIRVKPKVKVCVILIKILRMLLCSEYTIYVCCILYICIFAFDM